MLGDLLFLATNLVRDVSFVLVVAVKAQGHNSVHVPSFESDFRRGCFILPFNMTSNFKTTQKVIYVIRESQVLALIYVHSVRRFNREHKVS